MAFVPTAAATRYLMDAARSPQPRIRATALGGLARRFRAERNDPSAVSAYFQVFTEGLRTGDPSAVFVCAPALADSLFVAMGSVEALREAYEASDLPEDLEGMQAILRALGATGAPETERLLRQEMASATGALRVAAAQGLSALTGEDVEAPADVVERGREVDWEALSTLGSRPRLVLETEKGTVTLVLDAESAPLTVQTVAGFAREGLYDDTPFHRVVPNFVVQGGDFARQDGFGGPGFSIRSELTGIPYRRGVLGMASAGKDTEGSQFFITHSMAPHLDSGYTSFGWVETGMDVVDVLYEEDRILTARVEAGGA
jgi:peptidylprolyl isomerase